MALKTMLDKINEARAAYEKAMEEASSSIQEEIGKALAEAMKTLPEEYTHIKWRQYTPYFNDGDTCTFSVHEPYLISDSEDDYHGDDGLELSEWYVNHDIKEGRKPAEFKEQVEPLLTLWDSLSEDVLERAFGDHVRVTVTRDGTVEVDDCDHD